MIAQFKRDYSQHGHQWLLTGLVVVLGMQELRVLLVGFVGYLRDSVDVSSLDLAPIAVGVFALSFLAALLNRLAGPRSAMRITAGGLAIMRVAEQAANSAALDLAFSILAVALFLLYVPIALGIARTSSAEASTQLGLGFLLGLAMDSALFIAAKTLDLSWQGGIISWFIVLALAGSLIWLLRASNSELPKASDGNWLINLGLLALGPWMLLQALIFQNVGLIGSLTGWEAPAAGALLLLGNALALLFAGRLAHKGHKPIFALLLGLILLVVLFQVNTAQGLLSAAWLLAGQIVSLAIGLLIFQRAGSIEGPSGLLRTTLTFGFGQILFVLLLFVYYASYDLSLGLRAATLLPIVGGLVALGVVLSQWGAQSKPASSSTSSPALLAASFLLIPLVLGLTWPEPQTIQPPPNLQSLRVMDYNLHNAVNTSGRLDPEALAKVIEQSGADVVALQEVSRGWLTWGSLDMLSWLAQRLEMEYVWGPTADAQWGNALFSRYPITDYELFPLPPDDVLLLRGHIWARIDLGAAEPLNVIATHFSHRDDQDQVRVVQASAILDTWSSQPRTVVLGDLNARPDSEAIRLLVENGLVDVSAEIGVQPTYTYYADNPDHQIDYILVSPDLGYSDFSIPRTSASDHLPLIATIHLNP